MTLMSEGAASSPATIEPFRSLTDAALSGIRGLYDSVPSSRDALAVLFAIDAAQMEPTDAWVGFFVETVSSQLIWDERPTGTLLPDAAAWVLARFDEAPSIAILAILVRLMEEAQVIPPHFAADVRRRAALFGMPKAEAANRSRPTSVPYLRLVA